MKLVEAKKIFLLFIALFANVFVFSQNPEYLLEKPRNDSLVYDHGNIFSYGQRNHLEQKLRAYNDSTSVQIAIITLKDLGGYPINYLADEIGDKWEVGQKDTHNGVVILFSLKDKQVRISGGYGVQAKMPATLEDEIIQNYMIPYFKTENYFEGFEEGTNAIFKVLEGKYEAVSQEDTIDGFTIFLIFIITIAVLILLAKAGGGNNGGGGRRTYRRGLDDVIISNTGRRSWGGYGGGGSFGSGGGFGGFGGGSFGGGGATGSW